MLFWILAAFMTLLAALAVMRPFLRRQRADEGAGDGAHDVAVYRDQLRELERDAARGLIGAGEAEQARAEIGRRLLKSAEDSDASGKPAANGRGVRLIAMAAVLAVPVISWGLYAFIGSPGLPSLPREARLTQDPEGAPVEALIARAEEYLAQNPDDARGWEVLAPVYLRLGRFDDAKTAYQTLLRLSGDQPGYRAGLGEALVGAAEGLVTDEAEDAFRAALALEPANGKARFFLAIARAQDGESERAREMMRTLAGELPENSPWRQAARRALQAPAGEDPDAAGPTQEDIAAAAEMSGADRRAMVEGMVARLDERLSRNPRDEEGWRRLIRSYMVLERPGQARAALKRGVAAFGAQSAEARALQTFAARLGVAAER